jgi:rSAM/selenodomain-associated transferase 1
MASSAPLPDGPRIAVFAKAPVAGAVKTRLQPLLGAEGAAALQAGLVRRALATAIDSQVGEVELHCAPDTRHDFFARCAQSFRVGLVAQQGADLGERMRAAFARAFDAGHALIIIGADCPALSVEDLRAARDALRAGRAVIMPAEDGGYVLVGLTEAVPGLFAGVDWGTGVVLRQTRARLAEAGVRCVELRSLWDVDRPEDYARMQAEGLVVEMAP